MPIRVRALGHRAHGRLPGRVCSTCRGALRGPRHLSWLPLADERAGGHRGCRRERVLPWWCGPGSLCGAPPAAGLQLQRGRLPTGSDRRGAEAPVSLESLRRSGERRLPLPRFLPRPCSPDYDAVPPCPGRGGLGTSGYRHHAQRLRASGNGRHGQGQRERRGDAEACCTEFSQKLVASLQADARLIGKRNEDRPALRTGIAAPARARVAHLAQPALRTGGAPDD